MLLVAGELGFCSPGCCLKARRVLGALIGCGRRLSRAGEPARRPAGRGGRTAREGRAKLCSGGLGVVRGEGPGEVGSEVEGGGLGGRREDGASLPGNERGVVLVIASGPCNVSPLSSVT